MARAAPAPCAAPTKGYEGFFALCLRAGRVYNERNSPQHKKSGLLGVFLMMVSTKGRYALRVMVDLARHQTEDGYISLREITGRMQLSVKYVESILTLLGKGGMVSAARGKGGGYRLSRLPQAYTVAEVLNLTEGTLAPVACIKQGSQPCPMAQACPTRDMWAGLDNVIQGYLSGVTLQDLADA